MYRFNKYIHTNHARNKKYLLNEYKAPPKDRRKQIEDMKFDDETYRVFTDASELQKQGIFGLGFVCVGGGNIVVKARKYYNQKLKGQNTFAEVMAVSFAINQMHEVLKNSLYLPENVIVFSDFNGIERIDNFSWKDPDKKKTVEDVQTSINKFNTKFPNVNLTINYLSKKEQAYNPYYTAAHNASRKIVGIG